MIPTMSKSFIILWMLFNHVFDDYFLQGCLANLKQEEYWQKNIPENLYEFYRDDYLMALLMHSLSWSFMIMLPIAFVMSFNVDLIFVVFFFLNVIFHAVVDDMKANRKTINLVIDQSIHISQVLFTYLLLLG